MIAKTTWKEKMTFTAEADGHTIQLDAKSPIGGGNGLTPKELVAIGVAGCSAMDVVALMKKHKQPLEKFEVIADVTATEGVQPATFRRIFLTYDLTGAVDKEKAIEAVQLSQTKYCGVSAMLEKACPIEYKVMLNGEQIGAGHSAF